MVSYAQEQDGEQEPGGRQEQAQKPQRGFTLSRAKLDCVCFTRSNGVASCTWCQQSKKKE